MRGFLAGLLVIVLVPFPLLADPCATDARLRYPLSEVLRSEAQDLHLAEYGMIDWNRIKTSLPQGAEYRSAVSQALDRLPGAERDMRLLALLDVVTPPNAEVFLGLTTLSPSVMMDEFIAATKRQGLTAHSLALAGAKAAYPLWNVTPAGRRAQWTDGRGTITNPALRAMLAGMSRDFVAATPRPIERAVAMVQADPALLARYTKRRDAADDSSRRGYMLAQIWGCLGAWQCPTEADAALAAIAQPQRDLLIMDHALAESYNGSVHQFFFNSSGTLAPNLAEALERRGLPDHAAAIRSGMALFGASYPRDTPARRAVMAGFSQMQDDFLYDLTVWTDDGEIVAAIDRIARGAGLWPR